MNGVLQWGKRSFYSSFWNPDAKGGNLYYHIPYKLQYGGTINEEHLTKIVSALFKRNPDFLPCEISVGYIKPYESYITAVVVTSDRNFYEKYMCGEHKENKAV